MPTQPSAQWHHSPSCEHGRDKRNLTMTMESVFVPPDHGTSKKARARQCRRVLLFERQGGICYWCRKAMELNHFRVTEFGRTKHNPAFATFDHIIPREQGGYTHHLNIVLAHPSCNRDRKKRRWPHDPVFGNARLPRPDIFPRSKSYTFGQCVGKK